MESRRGHWIPGARGTGGFEPPDNGCKESNLDLLEEQHILSIA